MKKILPAIVYVFLFLACTGENNNSVISYNPISVSKCISDTTNDYHYLLPQKHGGILPLWIILDSGGDGLLAVNKMKPAVADIPCVLIGSDLIHNNYTGYKQAIRVLIDDACRKFPVSKDQVFVAGFSGGARMAFEFACDYPVKGVLMCGAGPLPACHIQKTGTGKPGFILRFCLVRMEARNKESARHHLSHAISLGFKDPEKMRNDFPAAFANEVMSLSDN